MTSISWYGSNSAVNARSVCRSRRAAAATGTVTVVVPVVGAAVAAGASMLEHADPAIAPTTTTAARHARCVAEQLITATSRRRNRVQRDAADTRTSLWPLRCARMSD